jgi:prevent-host-death family protein
MQKSISAAEANRRFSELLREVRKGHSYLITSHGREVARILPAERSETAAAHAKVALLRHLRAQKAIDIGPWTRDELYED